MGSWGFSELEYKQSLEDPESSTLSSSLISLLVAFPESVFQVPMFACPVGSSLMCCSSLVTTLHSLVRVFVCMEKGETFMLFFFKLVLTLMGS